MDISNRNSLLSNTMYRSILIALVYICAVNVHQSIAQNDVKEQPRSSDECQVTPVIHVLQYPGCVPKPIPSFACIGRCSSYLQVRKISAKAECRLLSQNSKCDGFFLSWKYRFRGVKSGRWNVHVCVVKSLVSVKQQCRYFVQKLSLVNENSERYDFNWIHFYTKHHWRPYRLIESFCYIISRYQQKRH